MANTLLVLVAKECFNFFKLIEYIQYYFYYISIIYYIIRYTKPKNFRVHDYIATSNIILLSYKLLWLLPYWLNIATFLVDGG